MGFFTLELARRVGDSGRVVAIDIQPKMIAALERRAAKAGLAARIDARIARPASLGIDDLAGRVDFVLAFAVVHEMPDAHSFFAQAAASMKPGGLLLLAEPRGHVKPGDFDRELEIAATCGLDPAGRPALKRGHAALLRKR